MWTNGTRMCAVVVGLPDVTVLAVDDQPGQPIRVHVQQRVGRPRCEECGQRAWVKDRPIVELVDLGCFGRPARLMWHKHRWCCPGTGLLGRVVDRSGSEDRRGPPGDDRPGGTVGDAAGGPARAHRQRGRP